MEISGYATLTPNQTLTAFTYTLRPLHPCEVLIEVSHCGLCHTDLHMMENNWKRSLYPLLPGHEIVGHVVQKGLLATCPLGQRVAVGWIHSTCLTCSSCLKGKTNICQNKKGIYNHAQFGGFATHVIADSRFIFAVPEKISSEHAAPLLCAGATVYAPLLSHHIRPGQSVGIIGIGGLGHLALQFGRSFGYEMIAISGSLDKKSDAEKLGASRFYTLDKLPPPNSLDFLLCTTDAILDWNALLALLRPGGKLCFVSRPPLVSFDPSFLVSTERSICGSNNASRSTIEEMLQFCERHSIAPWIEELPIQKINQGIEKLRRNQVRYRIVFTITDIKIFNKQI